MSSVQQNVIKHKVGLLNFAAELRGFTLKLYAFYRSPLWRPIEFKFGDKTELEAFIRLFALPDMTFCRILSKVCLKVPASKRLHVWHPTGVRCEDHDTSLQK